MISIKKYALYVLQTLLIIFIWYISAAFILLDLNCANWEESERFSVVSLGFLTSFAFITFNIIYNYGRP